MALKKLFVQDNGISTEYHKVNRVNLIDRNGEYPREFNIDEKSSLKLDVVVVSFLNEEYREKGHSINTNIYSFNITKDEEETLGIRKLAYVKLKTLDIFADAEDC